jgi:hypothetical protein
MGNTDDIIRSLRSIEAELIELESALVTRNGSLFDPLWVKRGAHVPTAADHARALLHEVRRIERNAIRRSED